MWTICDWELAIAAHAYESGQRTTMSDSTYDALSQAAHRRNTRLPGFKDFTGQWVAELDRDELQQVMELALSYNNGRDDLHLPAIQRALDELEMDYTCCNIQNGNGYACFDS